VRSRLRSIRVSGGDLGGGRQVLAQPKADLPAGFDDNRDVHHEVLSKPRDPAAFIADPQRRHTADLDRLETAMRRDTTGGAKITRKRSEPWIGASPLNQQ
jgi:hypothetical protein